MKAYVAFTQKELTESLRNYKVMIMLAVFLLFGIMSPLFAKLMPALLQNIGTAGIVITIPEPTAMDAWSQFFKNVGQMGMLVLAIVFAGIMANEFSRGTLIHILTKGMKRHTVILAKFTAAVLIWTLSYLLCLAVCYGYTAYYWGASGLHHAFLAFAGPWIFGVWLITLLILGGTLFKTFSGSLLFCGGVVVVLSLLGILPKAQPYNPVSLSGDGTALLAGVKAASAVTPALVICATLAMLFLLMSIALFNKKQL